MTEDSPGAPGSQPPAGGRGDSEEPRDELPATSDPLGPVAEPSGSPASGSSVEPASRRARLARWWAGDPVETPTPRDLARAKAIRRGITAAMVVTLLGSFVRLPLLITTPGPTFDTLGTMNGKQFISISGTRTYPTSGALDMTTVSERGGASGGVYLGEAIAGWFSSRASVIPREVFYDPEKTGEDISEANDQAFATSQTDAIAAAVRQLGIPTEDFVMVTLVGGGTPADGVLKPGDFITSVDGEAVETPAEVGAAVRRTTVGQQLSVEISREDDQGERHPAQVQLTTEANPTQGDLAGTPWIGIAVSTYHEPPFDVSFASANVGGPSAGLMFSLAILDKLTPGALTEGKHIAGTGTITPDGDVGPIGGVDKKIAGARSAGAGLFLTPPSNCNEVVGRVPDGLTVVPVATLDAAVSTVEDWTADPSGDFPTCEQVLEDAAG